MTDFDDFVTRATTCRSSRQIRRYPGDPFYPPGCGEYAGASLDKDARGRYVYVNAETTRILEVERERFIGFTDEEIFPRVGHTYWRKDQIVLSTRQPLITTDQVEKDRFLFCLRFPLELSGEPHVATVGVDTTSHMSALIGVVRLRDELFRNERMRSIGEMASGLVHDLSNNLNVSSMRLRLLKAKAGADLIPEIEAVTRSIEVATKRVQDVREYVTSRREEDFSVLNLEELLTAAINMVDFLIERTPTQNGGLIRIVRRAAGDLPALSVLPNQLKHVIANLLLNARDAMADGGELTIETRKTPSFAEIIVADEGSGSAGRDSRKNLRAVLHHQGHRQRPGPLDGAGCSFAHARQHFSKQSNAARR